MDFILPWLMRRATLGRCRPARMRLLGLRSGRLGSGRLGLIVVGILCVLLLLLVPLLLAVPLLLLLIVIVPLLLLLTPVLGLVLVPSALSWTPGWCRRRLLVHALRGIWPALLLLGLGLSGIARVRRSVPRRRGVVSTLPLLRLLIRLRLLRLILDLVPRPRRVLRILSIRRRWLVIIRWRRWLIPVWRLLMWGRGIVRLLRLRLGLLVRMPSCVFVRMVLVSCSLLFAEFALVARTLGALG